VGRDHEAGTHKAMVVGHTSGNSLEAWIAVEADFL
jgi:hypothetical protein